MSKLDRYEDGMDMGALKIIPEISVYNFNYFLGHGKDLLFARSDDDNTTEWFLISGEDSYFIGNSYTSDGDILERLKERHT